ncbi:unnamed protein product, partial [Prorocentrum cordatum]
MTKVMPKTKEMKETLQTVMVSVLNLLPRLPVAIVVEHRCPRDDSETTHDTRTEWLNMFDGCREQGAQTNAFDMDLQMLQGPEALLRALPQAAAANLMEQIRLVTRASHYSVGLFVEMFLLSLIPLIFLLFLMMMSLLTHVANLAGIVVLDASLFLVN